MSDELPQTWPLLPAHSSYMAHGLSMVLVDLVHGAGSQLSRRVMLEIGAVATALELINGEVAHWFGSRPPEDHELLEALEDRYMAERQRQGSEAPPEDTESE